MYLGSNPYEGMTPAEARYERETVRQLNRIMQRSTKLTGLPKLVGSTVVMNLLGIKRQTLYKRIHSGKFPPPMKGFAPAPGQSREAWERAKLKWPVSLVRMAVAGSFGADTPTTPDGWLQLIEGWQDGMRHD